MSMIFFIALGNVFHVKIDLKMFFVVLGCVFYKLFDLTKWLYRGIFVFADMSTVQ